MYDRKIKWFFGFMALVMVIGYPLSMVAGLPAFQSIFGGATSATSATQRVVDEAHEKVTANNCGDTKITGDRVETCKQALRDLGAGYQALSLPPEEGAEAPADADRNMRKALEAFERLHALDPKDLDSKLYLANAHVENGTFGKAVPLYAALVKANPDDPDYLYRWAAVTAESGDKEQGIKLFERFLKEAPDDAKAEYAKEAIESLKNPTPDPGLQVQ